MIAYVLDTDIITLYAQGNWNVTRRIYLRRPQVLGVAVISAQELIEGWLSFIKRNTKPDQIARGYAELAATIALLGAFALGREPSPTCGYSRALQGVSGRRTGPYVEG